MHTHHVYIGAHTCTHAPSPSQHHRCTTTQCLFYSWKHQEQKVLSELKDISGDDDAGQEFNVKGQMEKNGLTFPLIEVEIT